jgi:hypothetical protein
MSTAEKIGYWLVIATVVVTVGFVGYCIWHDNFATTEREMWLTRVESNSNDGKVYLFFIYPEDDRLEVYSDIMVDKVSVQVGSHANTAVKVYFPPETRHRADSAVILVPTQEDVVLWQKWLTEMKASSDVKRKQPSRVLPPS